MKLFSLLVSSSDAVDDLLSAFTALPLPLVMHMLSHRYLAIAMLHGAR